MWTFTPLRSFILNCEVNLFKLLPLFYVSFHYMYVGVEGATLISLLTESYKKTHLISNVLFSFPWKLTWGKLNITRSNLHNFKFEWSFILVASTPCNKHAPSLCKSSKFDFAFLYIFITSSTCEKAFGFWTHELLYDSKGTPYFHS